MPEVKASGFFFEGCYNKCKEGVKRDSLKRCRVSVWRDKIRMDEMANYVFHRVVCTQDFFEKYLLDLEPFGKNDLPEHPCLTFRKLFGAVTLEEYEAEHSASVYKGYGFHWEERPNDRVEVKFCTRWQYPIEAILKALKLGRHTIEWFACEENHLYASWFRWTENGAEERILLLGDTYWNWTEQHGAALEKQIGETECDDEVWYYLPLCKSGWQKWPSSDDFSRYVNTPAVQVEVEYDQLEMKHTQLVMCREPFADLTIEQVEQLLQAVQMEKELADIYAGTENKAWWLSHDEYDFEDETPECLKARAKTRAWFALADRAENQILERLRAEGKLTNQPDQRERLKRFMRQNGWTIRDGWWMLL